ncbi:ABC transporter permease [Halobacteriales archaeon SW_7_68_16]|nr:MAG: ABC transporter permease [Halobacteriales archaeon SW_7_68_16]
MSRWTYFAKRLLLSLPVVLLGTTLTFAMIRLGPLSPADALAGQQGGQAVENIKTELGLTRPLWEQYIGYMTDLLTFDLGQSWVFRENTPTIDLIESFAPRTIWLGFWSVLIALFVGIPLGFYAGLNPNTTGDYVASFGGIVWRAMPNFWLAVILVVILTNQDLLFGFNWADWLVDTNVIGPPPMTFVAVATTSVFGIPIPTEIPTIYFGTLAAATKSIAPAALVLGSASMGNEMRIGRTAILETKNAKYVETARAKGVSRRALVWKHMFRNALIPLVPIILNEAFLLIGGSIIVETIFGINGIGYMFYEAVINGDLPLAGSLAYIFILIIVSLNILQDLLYTIIDPRVGYQE